MCAIKNHHFVLVTWAYSHKILTHGHSIFMNIQYSSRSKVHVDSISIKVQYSRAFNEESMDLIIIDDSRRSEKEVCLKKDKNIEENKFCIVLSRLMISGFKLDSV